MPCAHPWVERRSQLSAMRLRANHSIPEVRARMRNRLLTRAARRKATAVHYKAIAARLGPSVIGFALLLFPVLALAQDTVAPTTGESTLPPRGENAGDYNVVQSWEFGYRFATVGGDDGQYRTNVNYGNGVRLLSSYLTINSRDGHGRWFDEITLTTQGLGNDPYQSVNLGVQKNKWYRYDFLWRSNSYFNPGLVVADGEHLENTTYQWRDNDLTLFPQSWFRVHAGYSRTTQDGPALTTTLEFDPSGDVFPVFRDTRQQYNGY